MRSEEIPVKTSTTIIWNVAVALGLMLVASAARAQDPEVLFDDNGYVVEIRNLTVVLHSEEPVLFDVEFLLGSAFDVYGPDLEFDFGTADSENAVLSIIASFEALNDEIPIPMRAGPDGADQFFAGTNLVQEGVIESFGAEYFVVPTGPNTDPNTWGECDRHEQSAGQAECILGVLVIDPNTERTWARFTPAAPADTPEISLMPEALTPAALLSEDATADEILVENSGEGTLDYSIAVETDLEETALTWLSVSQSSGSLSGGESDPITVSYSTSSLAASVYHATITVTDSNDLADPQMVVVTLLVTTQSTISLSETMFLPESAPGTDPLPDSFTVLNSGGLLLFYDVSVDVDWMSVNPESGLSVSGTPDTIDVLYDTSSLSLGAHEGTIEVTAPNAVNNPQRIVVMLTIAPAELSVTEVRPTAKVLAIPGLEITTDGTYVVGFPLSLPKSEVAGSTVSHDGGAFFFESPTHATTFRDWTFEEVRSTCAAVTDPCPVDTTVVDSPWELRNVDLTAGTAMVFTQSGMSELNNLADEDIFQVEETFAHVNFIPEPSAAALGTAAITALGLIRLASRRRRN